ncbi:MAG: putative zinc-binding protein [Bacteroidales bacterium]
MIENYAILPCNGLDKCAGVIAGELAIRLSEKADNEIICPVFYRVSENRYNRIASERSLLVIDGCQTRCASKLATEKNLKISRKVIITEEAKNHNVELNNKLRILDNEQAFINTLLSEFDKAGDESAQSTGSADNSYDFVYETFQNGKFIFRIPANSDVFFNENDCWAYVKGTRARIGVTDYVQQNLSDILYFSPPEIGAEIDQFGEAGSIESSKSVFELISPVSGKIISVNEKLEQNPELINENPYELGWIAELELSDFESDKELLIGFESYIEITRKKVEESK